MIGITFVLGKWGESDADFVTPKQTGPLMERPPTEYGSLLDPLEAQERAFYEKPRTVRQRAETHQFQY
jgi:hypothetical protein